MLYNQFDLGSNLVVPYASPGSYRQTTAGITADKSIAGELQTPPYPNITYTVHHMLGYLRERCMHLRDCTNPPADSDHWSLVGSRLVCGLIIS